MELDDLPGTAQIEREIQALMAPLRKRLDAITEAEEQYRLALSQLAEQRRRLQRMMRVAETPATAPGPSKDSAAPEVVVTEMHMNRMVDTMRRLGGKDLRMYDIQRNARMSPAQAKVAIQTLRERDIVLFEGISQKTDHRGRRSQAKLYSLTPEHRNA